MQSTATTVPAYVSSLPADRQEAVNALRAAINGALPVGFVEQMSYGMIGWVVPHALYPAGYHCDPKLPLPFMALASQKQNLSLYHMGLYADDKLLSWFTAAHAQASARKLDMGKSCIRYRKLADVPLALIAELAGKLTVAQWIARYESGRKR
ncbi:MAG: DUF1801 domain-containing protein [Rubrivivax sp.]|nr:DUF1801 domain-containing protein [Rubrivivax sp.]